MKTSNRIRLFFTILFINSLSGVSSAQQVNLLDSIQGIWKEIRVNENEISFKIIKGNYSLGISVYKPSNGLYFSLAESIVGFQNHNFEEVDSIDVGSLDGAGKYYTEVLDPQLKGRWAQVSDCNLSRFFEYHDNYMAVTVVRMAQYQRANRLPATELKLLHEKGIEDKRNYIKEYLNVDVLEIKSDSPVASQPKGITKVVLPKGELVYLKETKGTWRKIQYEKNEDLHQGWIERKYLK